MTWYEHWFDRDEYELVSSDRDESEADRLVQLIIDVLAPPDGARILDVGCGRGRHSRAFARRGFQVTGLDLSARAVRRARKSARDADLQIRFVRGDMRETVQAGGFDLVVNLHSAFGFFDDPSDHVRAIEAMAGALAPSGVLVQDFLNADHLQRHLPPPSSRRIEDTVIRQRRWIEEGRVKKEILFERSGSSHTFVESVALLSPEDFTAMYRSAGLVEFDRRGAYDGRPFDAHSERLILFARHMEEA